MYSFYFVRNCTTVTDMTPDKLKEARQHYRQSGVVYPIYVSEVCESYDEKWQHQITFQFVGGMTLTGRGKNRTNAIKQVIEFLTSLCYHKYESSDCIEDIVSETENTTLRNIRFGKYGIDRAAEIFTKE